MKSVMLFSLAVLGLLAFAEEPLPQLTPEQKDLLSKNYSKLSPAEKKLRDRAAEIDFMLKEGGEMDYPGTPRGRIAIVNLQKRVPPEQLRKLRDTFSYMMEYDLCFLEKDEPSEISVKIVDVPGAKALTVWPDEGRAEVNVAALAGDNPKPAFLAARTRKEVIRAFSCATAGSTYGAALFGKLRKGVKSLDDIASEDFTLDVIMRTNRYLDEAGVKPIRHATYKEVLMDGYDVKPTNACQRVLYERIKKTRPLTRKVK